MHKIIMGSLVMLCSVHSHASERYKFNYSVNDVLENRAVIKKSKELGACLHMQWGIDAHTTSYILKKFDFLLQNVNHHAIIDEFILKSQAFNINFSVYPALIPLPTEDGVFQAPQQHLVIFENPWIRILWGSTKPGQKENFHVHAWQSLMVVVQPTTYEITFADGTIETNYWDRGVYALAAEQYACVNIGNNADECIRFEIKQTKGKNENF